MDPRVPHALFDALIKEFGLKNDRGLAEWLGTEPPNVSRIRSGHKKIGPGTILRVYHKAKWPIEKIEALL